MAKKITSIKDFEIQCREALINYYYGLPIMLGDDDTHHIDIYVPEPTRSGQLRHNYQIDDARSERHGFIKFKNLTLGELWSKPHKQIKIYERYDQDRLYAKVLERVARDYVPEAKVQITYGE